MGWSKVAYFAVLTALIYCQTPLFTEANLPANCDLLPQAGLTGLCENIASKTGACQTIDLDCTNQPPITQAVLNTLEGCTSDCQRLAFAYACQYTCLNARATTPACSAAITSLFNACKTCGTGTDNIVQNTATPAAFAQALGVTLSQDASCANFAANARDLETTVPTVTSIVITTDPLTHDNEANNLDADNSNAATEACQGGGDVRFVTVNVALKIQSLESPTEAVVECIPPGAIIPASSVTIPAEHFKPVLPVTNPHQWETVSPFPACRIGTTTNPGNWRINVIPRNTFGTSSSLTDTTLTDESIFKVDETGEIYKNNEPSTPFVPDVVNGQIAACPTTDSWGDVDPTLHDTACADISFATTYLVGGEGTGLRSFECCLDHPCILSGVAGAPANFILFDIRNGDILADVTLRSLNEKFIIRSLGPVNGDLKLQAFQPLELHAFTTAGTPDLNGRVPDANEPGLPVEVLSLDTTSQILQRITQNVNDPVDCLTQILIPTELRTKWKIESDNANVDRHCILAISSSLVVHDNTKPPAGTAEEPKTNDHFNLQLVNCAELVLSVDTALFELFGRNNAVADVVLRGLVDIGDTNIALCPEPTVAIDPANLGNVWIRSGYLQVLNGYSLRFDVQIAGATAPTAHKAATSAVLVPIQRTAVEECWCAVCGRDVTVISGGALLLGRPADEITNECRAFTGFTVPDADWLLTPFVAYNIRALDVKFEGVVVFKGVRKNGPILYVGFGATDATVENPILAQTPLGGDSDNAAAVAGGNGRAIFEPGSIIEVELDLALLPTEAHEIILMRYRTGVTTGVCNVQASLRIANQAQLGALRVPELKCIVNAAFATAGNPNAPGDNGPFTLILSVPAAPPPSPPSGPGAGAGSKLSTNQFVLFLDQSAVEFPQSAFLAAIETCLTIDDQNVKIEAYNLVDGDVHVTFRCVDNTPGTANELCQRIVNEALNENSCLGQATKAFTVDENSDFDRDEGSNEALFGLFAIALLPVCCCLICFLWLKNRKREADNQYMQDTATFSNVAAAPQPINTVDLVPATYPVPYDPKGPIYV